MLTVHLCTAFNFHWGRLDPYAPLGLLSVAGVAEAGGHEVRIKDPNTAFPSFHHELDLERVAAYLVQEAPDLLGFSTLCNCYPLTLRLAQRAKRLRPEALVVLGGPQGSATARRTLESFREVDAVLSGEGEIAFGRLLAALEAGDGLEAVPNLVWRSPSGIVENPRAPLVPDLDALPLPAYHLNPFSFAERGEIAVEAGRGCPYQCVYCSTSRFWGRRFRMKSARRLVDDVRALVEEHDVPSVELVHDNFTSSPRRVLEFCRLLQQEGLELEWSCSARIDAVDTELAMEMARSGCKKVFYGIESGSEAVRRVIGKKMDYSCVVPHAETTARSGITFTGSFIIGFPEETLTDLRSTMALMLRLRYTGGRRNFTHLHLLSPLSGTPVQSANQERLFFDGQPSDLSVSVLAEDDRALIRKHPEIFSAFYAVPTPSLPRTLLRKVYLIMNFSMDFPYTVYLLWKSLGEGLVDRILERADALDMDDNNVFAVDSGRLTDSLHAFLRDHLLPETPDSRLITEVLRYEHLVNTARRDGNRVELFAFDVEELLGRLSRDADAIPTVEDWSPSAYAFSYSDSKVRTVKLAEPLARLLATGGTGSRAGETCV